MHGGWGSGPRFATDRAETKCPPHTRSPRLQDEWSVRQSSPFAPVTHARPPGGLDSSSREAGPLPPRGLSRKALGIYYERNISRRASPIFGPWPCQSPGSLLGTRTPRLCDEGSVPQPFISLLTPSPRVGCLKTLLPEFETRGVATSHPLSLWWGLDTPFPCLRF